MIEDKVVQTMCTYAAQVRKQMDREETAIRLLHVHYNVKATFQHDSQLFPKSNDHRLSAIRGDYRSLVEVKQNPFEPLLDGLADELRIEENDTVAIVRINGTIDIINVTSSEVSENFQFYLHGDIVKSVKVVNSQPFVLLEDV